MATKKKTETETSPIASSQFDLDSFLAKLNFIDAHERSTEKAGQKALEVIQAEFDLPSKDGKIQVPNHKDPANGPNLLSRNWWTGFLFPGLSRKPGEPSPLPQRIQSLCGLLSQQKTQKTEKADFIGGEPPKSNPTFISLPKYKKVPVENRERELRRLLRPLLLLPGLSPDAAYWLKCLCDGTSTPTTTTIPASGTGVLTPEGKVTIKKELPPPSMEEIIQKAVAIAMATKA